MPYDEYCELVNSLTEHRSKKSNASVPRNLRPVQKSAIAKAKKLKK